MLELLNNNGNGYTGLSFNSSGGYVPPDTCGAAGPFGYVETVNQAIGLYLPKDTGATALTDNLSHFFFSTGGLSRTDSGSGLSDPIVCYDELNSRYIIGDQDVNFSTHLSSFDLAVSRTNNPTSLTAADWKFYKINTTETGFDADYPGNFGYNADAFVFTLNMFPVSSGGGHVQIVSMQASDLANAVTSPLVARNDLADFSLRPTTMHDSITGDPMWFVTEHGDNQSVDVVRMQGELSTTPTYTYTNLAVTPYSAPVAPKSPNGVTLTQNIDARIDKCASANNTLVAAHSVGVSSTQDVVQWYAINLAGGTPSLQQQGRLSAGNNTYLTYPGIDINPASAIGMSYVRSGTDTSTDYMSMWVTGRVASDPLGTMQTAVIVPSAQGQANYTDFATSSGHRAGDLSGINVDPVDGSFWAANEYANTQATANWGTGIVNFRPNGPSNPADLAVSVTGPATVTAGQNASYTVTLNNNGPNAASGVVLSDLLPSGSTLVSMTQISGSDVFSLGQSGATITETASAAIASGSSDSFTLVVTASASLVTGSSFSDTASVSSGSASSDPNSANNSATATASIVGGLPAGDVAVSNVAGVLSANEGDTITYTVKVSNNDASKAATGVVLKDTLDSNLLYVSATSSQGSFSRSGNVITFNLGTIAAGGTVNLVLKARAIEEGTVSNATSVSSSSSDGNPANNSATVSTTVSEPVIVVSAPKTITTRNNNNLVVASFSHAGGIEATGAFKAIINWGDGKTSTGSITLSGTTYTVRGSHAYTSGISHKVTTTVTELGQAAELLMAKMGDEQPELPEQHRVRPFHFDLANLPCIDALTGILGAAPESPSLDPLGRLQAWRDGCGQFNSADILETWLRFGTAPDLGWLPGRQASQVGANLALLSQRRGLKSWRA